jgi:hypothetical protein
MGDILNRVILSKYRDIIINDIAGDIAYNAISLTNRLENNTLSDKSKNILTNMIKSVKTDIANYKPDKNVTDTIPAIWQINYGDDKNITNSCTFALSTSSLYKTQVKYVNSNKDGTTTLSLFNGGNDGKFILENANVLSSNTNASNQTTFVAISANIRAFNKLYMLPTVDNNGLFNNSNVVKLSSSPEINGKWIILGFSLSKLEDLKNIFNSIQF